ncbi:hypothetical protein CLAVI_000788 [Candidatus Clavichlamydia salmonicola]|uniref:hypothetical protein n=1 Tax=Candidatus Clavichlamydia salmonicola TaxID=469812 RepID=UPI001891ED97|nr:hypothetical protein [Candidatus Clavichlamydia salmonicola]MBF5051152.1 hypothetical protein [Candidatus Clavichlamydia salmonicola]
MTCSIINDGFQPPISQLKDRPSDTPSQYKKRVAITSVIIGMLLIVTGILLLLLLPLNILSITYSSMAIAVGVAISALSIALLCKWMHDQKQHKLDKILNNSLHLAIFPRRQSQYSLENIKFRMT